MMNNLLLISLVLLWNVNKTPGENVVKIFDVNEKEIIVNPGDNLLVEFKGKSSINECKFFNVSRTHIVDWDLQEMKQPTEIFQDVCKLNMTDINDEFNGFIFGEIVYEEDEQHYFTFVKLTVTEKPYKMRLDIKDDILKGSVLNISCKVHNARPPAQLEWLLDGEIIDNRTGSIVKSYITRSGGSDSYTTFQELSFNVSTALNEKNITCRAVHQLLTRGEMNDTKKIDVMIIPDHIFKTDSIIYNAIIGNNATIIIQIEARPEPNITWTIGNDEYSKLLTSDNARITYKIEKRMYFRYDITLQISNVTKDDILNKYYLSAVNNYGERRITLELNQITDPEYSYLLLILVTCLSSCVVGFLVATKLTMVTKCFRRESPTPSPRKDISSPTLIPNHTMPAVNSKINIINNTYSVPPAFPKKIKEIEFFTTNFESENNCKCDQKRKNKEMDAEYVDMENESPTPLSSGAHPEEESATEMIYEELI